MQIIVQMENNSGALLYIDSAYISSKENNYFCDTSARSLLLPCLLIFLSNTTTHIEVDGSGGKKIKLQNKAELTRNEASMGAEFLVNSALFCNFIFFAPEPATSMCVNVQGVLNHMQPWRQSSSIAMDG